TVPVLSADASIHVVVSNEIDPLTIADTEPNKALTWTVSGDVPSGVTASEDANGMTYTLSGAPAKWGDYSFSVIASNAKGSDDVKVSVTVYTAPVLSDDAGIKAVKGSAMSQTFPAVSGNHLAWTLSGDLPSGLSVSSDDNSFTVSGTPSTAGDYSFTLTASNMAGSDDIAVNVTVYEMPLLPDSIITIEASKDFALVEQNVTAAAGNYLAWSVDGTLPAGITVYSEDNAMTATIMGTPTKAGDYDFYIVAGNYAGSSSIEVSAIVYEAPEISGSEADIQAVEGRAFSAREIPATAGNHLTWTRTGTFPDGLTFSGNDSALSISGTPGANSAGRYESTFTASNPAGSASVRVRIFVSGKNFVVTSRDVSSSTTLEDFLATLSPEQAAAIETLTLNEYFTDLSGLGTLTGLKELDVSGATALKEVNLDGNTSVTALKVSGNESVNRLILSGSVVETVNAEGCTGLGSVDIAGSTTIRELNVSGTAVEVLDATDCVNLETLLCASCRISEFYLAGCSSLVTLDFSGNAIRKFNARGFPELVSLDCISQTIEVDVLRRNFAFREFMDAAKVSFVEGVQTLRASGVDSPEDLNVKDITGYDASGDEISADYDAESGVVRFSAIPHKIAYVYMVLDGASMDVLISGDAESEVRPVLEGETFTIEATEGRQVTARTIAATAGDNLTWTASGDLPRGMAGTAESDGKGFTVSGTPATGTAGTYTYTVTATNPAGSASADVTVNVSAVDVRPVLEGETFTIEATEGRQVTARTISATAGDNLTWTASGDLPRGMAGTAESDGRGFTVSGTPATGTAGTYRYTVTATNNAGSASAVVTLNVSVVEVRPVLEGETFTIEATEGQAVVARTIAALSGDNLTWTASGDLPRGMAGTAESDGRGFTISGTPVTGTAGTYTYTVTATNTAGSASAVVTVRVSSPVVPPSPSAPVFDKRSYSLHAKEGEAVAPLTVTATSGDNLTWSSSGTLPSGLTGTAASDAKSYTISGTPSAGTAGDYTYTVTARNSAGESSASVRITVSQVINTQGKSSLSEAISQLTAEQAESITNLAVGGNVTDLSGLDKLTNLEALDLTEATSLTGVNLNGNTSVKDVEISGNSSVKSLTLGRSNVETVDAEGCGALEEVNIAGSKTVKELNVSSTNISSINASGCENLEVLECSSCKIDSLNLEGCVSLRELDFRGNGIRRFSAGGFRRLETLSCSGQKVTGQIFSRVFSLWDFLSAAQVSGVYASDADEGVRNVKGYDSSGNEIESQYNEATGEVTFASVPSRITYDYDTGFDSDNPYMDVAVIGSAGGDTGIGHSSGGCDGFASFAAFVLSAIFALTRKD
ncbi:MAG: putative Ig domain-containing protein, partial [Synergistaceae bacterium]|nr:putative Ig domain-containing protein [Synergistaceae bacterium]